MLNDEQIDFLVKELKRPRSFFANMSPYEAHDIRELCSDIEVAEVIANDICPRGEMAADIADVLYEYEEIPPDEIVSFTDEQAKFINQELKYGFDPNIEIILEPWRIKDIYTRCKEISDNEQHTSRGNVAASIVKALQDKRRV